MNQPDSTPRLRLAVLPGRLAVCRLDSGSPVPDWFHPGPLSSVTWTDDELSVIVPEDVVPEGITAETGWAAIKVLGPLDFSLTGILSSIARPLAAADISIFAVSTYDTDYIMVKAEVLQAAVDILSADFDI